jgi:hypothetical protein
VSTKANVPQFWDEMNGLMLMNRRILQQKRSNENARQNITTSSPTSGERSTSESHQAVVTSFETGVTGSQGVQNVFPSTKEQVNDDILKSASVTPGTDLKTNFTNKISVDVNKQTTTLVNLKSEFQLPRNEHRVVKEKSENDGLHENLLKDILIYSGIIGGVVIASVCVIVIVLVQKRRHDRRLATTRFTATDQKTYKDTKIFVMANNEKSDSIVSSFNAIPSNSNLWKELQCNSPNIF